MPALKKPAARPSRRAAKPDSERRKIARLSMRIATPAKAMLERAAAYSGASVSDYVVTRALAAAEADIHTHEKITLPPAAWGRFFDALGKPPPANARLNALLKTHDKSVISK